jgi:heat shock protein HtpX
MNMLKTTALMAAMAILLVFIGGALGGRTGMTFALVMAFGLNFFTYWYSDRVVLRMYKAREVTEAQAPELFGVVRTLASRAQLPMPRLYVIDQPQPNAFATGRNPSHAAVAVTTGIMRLLDRDELMGVLGHELAHIKNRDILIGTIAATFAAAISYLAYMAQWAMIFGGGDEDDGGNPFAAIVMMIVGPIAAMLIQLAISRSREYGADRGGAEVAGNPLYLAGALRKLQQASKEIPMHASPATSHMFIVNPLRGGKMAKLFSTHPPMEERVARLEAMAAGRSL